jgi:creatinine amidohydrolase/Fe(II)-dependent formamide hydrolase-like protein
VCLIPVATLENHGPHLPIDADLRIVEEICRLAAAAVPDEVVLLPATISRFSTSPDEGSAWTNSVVLHWNLDRPDPRA